MRELLIACAAVSLLVPASALADDKCPAKITPDLVTSFGDPVGTVDKGQTLHQLAGSTMLGQPSPYVVVTRTDGGDAVEEIDYRIGTVMHNYSELYPIDVRKAFDKAYPGGNCGGSKVTSCSIAFQGGGSAGRLAAVKLGEGAIDSPDDAQGPQAVLVKNDFGSDAAGPVFLVCLYDTGD
jgi:hypothetical protein